MSKRPSPTADNGRGPGGRFAKGNKSGAGNPLHVHVQLLRAALLRSVTGKELEAVGRKLLMMALQGDVAAIRELLNRLLGPPVEADLLGRIETLEAVVRGRKP